ncbi:hypothetical protein JF66_07080 [Cryobacterium sp. MLB-32]|uniref:hypothetical protein n=1 Tax=Cryobacterium sp. MLB-32 TaxID=1529318 RepID=UPI0004E7A3FF|nr:hypothetical protein [Cryobacterium sp. MLB-32]KFF60039.1 hypothetical protein JF66_07080 [Cryobacterium sp. MLB-32]
MTDVSQEGPPRPLASPRAASLAGVLFALFFAAGLILLRSALPETPETAPDWSGDAGTRIRIAVWLMPFAGIMFLWYIGVLRDTFGEGEDKLFSSVFLGSGILFLAMVFVATAIAGALLSMYESGAEPDVSAAAISRAVILQIENVYALRMAGIFMLSLGTLWLRTGALTKWASLFTYSVAAVLLVVTSFSVWVSLIFPAWALVISVFLLERSYRTPTQLR